jgi:hypothetical protein
MWSKVESLKTLSPILLWIGILSSLLTVILGRYFSWISIAGPALAVAAMGFRYYVDRRAGQMSAQRHQEHLDAVHQEHKDEAVKLQAQISPLQNAVPPRIITPTQRATFIQIVLDPANSCPKPSLKILIGDSDLETENFAKSFKRLLADSGYMDEADEIAIKSSMQIRPVGNAENRRRPPLIAIFSSADHSIPPPNKQVPLTIQMMYPTTFSISRGDTSHPRIYRYSDNPNEILHGICSVLHFIGLTPNSMSGFGLLEPGDIGFFIPKQF